jgi:uncharacterized membrane protein
MAKKSRKDQRGSGGASAPASAGASKLPAILYTVAALLAVAGLADATYLTASHFAGETVTCFGTAGCSDVLGSAFSKLGPVPLAGLGVVAYFAAFTAATLAAFGFRHARTVLLWCVGLMFLTTLALLYVQAFVLHAFCSYCLLSAALTFALAGVVIMAPAVPSDAS